MLVRNFYLAISLLLVFTSNTYAENDITDDNADYKTARIVGGGEAGSTEWPSTAAIQENGSVTCGASIISSRWVLTAAHCVSGVSTSSLKVIVGTSDLASGGVKIRVRRKIIHPNYNVASFNADLALLELDRKTSVSAIKVSSNEARIGEVATVVGWGALNEGDPTSLHPSKLNEVQVPIVDRVVCKSLYGFNRVTDNMICAGYTAGGKDACTGDSGGPLMVYESGKYVQKGIVSWGEGCAQAGKYGVYTRLSKYKNWIDSYASGGGIFGGGSFNYLLLPFLLLLALRFSLLSIVKK